VEGALNMAEAAFELAMARAREGMVVNVTLSPHHGMPGMAHSGAARATVEALTRELAERWRGDGVAVTAVAAGHFDTEVLAKYPASVRAGASRTVPLQRLGTVSEHAWLVALLASPLGRALNGSTITLDGARDNWCGPWPPPGLADEAGAVPVEERR
jgi:citronellol/citronellal dehydrogenase